MRRRHGSASWRHITPTGVLAALAFALPPLQAYARIIVVPLLVIASLAIAVSQPPRSLRPPGWLAAILVLVAGLGLASAGWAVEPRFTLTLAAKLAGLFVCCLIVVSTARTADDRQLENIRTALLLGFLLELANVELAFLTDAAIVSWTHGIFESLFGPQRPVVLPVWLDTAMTLIGLLLWPAMAMAAARFGWLAAVLLYVLAVLIMGQGFSYTTLAALIAATLVFAAAWLLPRTSGLLCGLGTAGSILAAPWLLQPEVTAWLTAHVPFFTLKEGSWQHRRAIWGFVIERIEERPWTGWGLGSSRAIPGGHEQISPGVEILPLHPHDAALQLWLELGVPGALLGALFMVLLTWAICRNLADRTQRAMALALMTSGWVSAMASYNLWHEWWLTFLIVAACFFMAATGRESSGFR